MFDVVDVLDIFWTVFESLEAQEAFQQLEQKSVDQIRWICGIHKSACIGVLRWLAYEITWSYIQMWFNLGKIYVFDIQIISLMDRTGPSTRLHGPALRTTNEGLV